MLPRQDSPQWCHEDWRRVRVTERYSASAIVAHLATLVMATRNNPADTGTVVVFGIELAPRSVLTAPPLGRSLAHTALQGVKTRARPGCAPSTMIAACQGHSDHER